MLKQHQRLVSTALYVADISVIILSFFLAYHLRAYYINRLDWDILGNISGVGNYYWLLILIVPVWTVLFVHYKAYRSFRTEPITTELRLLYKVTIVGGLLIMAAISILKHFNYSRGHVLVFIAVSLVMVTAERLCVRLLGRHARKRGYNYRNVVIVGTDESAARFLGLIEKNRAWGLRTVGFVTCGHAATPAEFRGYPVLGGIDDMEDIIRKNVVDEVLFSSSKNWGRDIEEVFLMIEDFGINVRMAFDFFPNVRANVRLDEFEDIPLLLFSTIPSNSFTLALKRVFDIAVSLSMFMLAMPLMTAAAILIKAESRGPLFFRQKRCGLNGRTFTLYKFRSMVMDAEERKEGLMSLNEMDGPVFKIRNDPRITRVGRIIRRASIDEFPQLWNVLRGDMSIVGPRPPLPDEITGYKRWQKRRLSMKPGLTCLWQISGRNRVKDFDEWVRLDLEYIDRWSLGLDFKIFLKTIPVVFFGKGAA